MGAISDFVEKEWRVIVAAPATFVAAILLIGGGGFYAGTSWRGQEVANLQTLVQAKDGQLTEYKGKLDDLASRVGKIEQQLSISQANVIKSLIDGKAGSVEIINWQDNPAPALLQQYQTLLKDSGWTATTRTAAFDRPDQGQAFVLQPESKSSGDLLREAMDRAQVQYEVKPSPDTAEPDQLWVKAKQSVE